MVHPDPIDTSGDIRAFSAGSACYFAAGNTFRVRRVALDEKEQETLTSICEASETARTTYQLGFVRK
jgi:hypothetical protein